MSSAARVKHGSEGVSLRRQRRSSSVDFSGAEGGDATIITSTPIIINAMDAMNNDSGYVSHHASEFGSNFESGGDFRKTVESTAAADGKPIYLSEDALLEKPDIKTTAEFMESTLKSFNENSSASGFSLLDSEFTDDSVVSASETSTSTQFSGLQEQDSNLSDVIEEVRPISVKLENLLAEGATPMKAGAKKPSSDFSPDLFSDEEEEKARPVGSGAKVTSTGDSGVARERYVVKNDRKLLRRVNDALNGVLPPPPSLTVVHLSVEEMVAKIEQNRHLFWRKDSSPPPPFNEFSFDNTSLLITGEKTQCLDRKWPEILEPRYHGLHFNRSKLSEEFENLCAKYANRYVGNETQSTCTVFECAPSVSPSKKRANRLRWVVKSPGRRLSHLARRRITFTSSSLSCPPANSNIGARARQILVDARKLGLLNRRKSPRKTPSKSPGKKGRTPSSSAKKRLAMQFRLLTEDGEPSTSSAASLRASVTKRALFQSPENSKENRSFSTTSKPKAPLTAAISGSSVKKKGTPKRALFTSPVKKQSPNKCTSGLFEKKRKRSESDDQRQPSKLSRTISGSEHDSCGGGSENRGTLSQQGPGHQAAELSAHHKKKLQWAVYEALRTQNVGVAHPQFKVFASVLARVTRRFLPNLMPNAPRPEGGTSDRMLRIARQHVFAVTKGKTVEEIVREQEGLARTPRPVGYIGKGENATKSDVSTSRGHGNVLQDRANIMSSVDRRRSLLLGEENLQKLKIPGNGDDPSRLDRIRKVIDFGDTTPNAR